MSLFYLCIRILILVGFFNLARFKKNAWTLLTLAFFAQLVLGISTFSMSWNDFYVLGSFMIAAWAFYQRDKASPLITSSNWNEADLILDELEAEPVVVGSVRRISSSARSIVFYNFMIIVGIAVIWGFGNYYFMTVPEDLEDFFSFKGIKNALHTIVALFGLWLLSCRYVEAWIVLLIVAAYSLFLWFSFLLDSMMGYFFSSLLALFEVLFFAVYVFGYNSWKKALKPKET